MEHDSMDEPRWIAIGRIAAAIALAAVGTLFIVAMLTSDASGIMKLIGVLGIGLVVGGGAIRIWLASRPYGLGRWQDRHLSGR